MSLSKGKKTLTVLSAFALLFLFSFLIPRHTIAQVNINSSENTKPKYYELTDSIINFSSASPTENNINNDFLNIFTQPDVDANGNITYKTIFSSIEQMIKDSPFIPEGIKQFILTNGLPTSVSFGVSLFILPLLLSFLPLLLAPQLLLVLLASIFGERKNVLGIVYDIKTTKPIPFVVVRVFRAGSTQLIIQKITDLQGRYGFVLSEGKYRVSINHSGYEKFQKDIEIKEDVDLFAEDIPLGTGKNVTFIQNISIYYRKVRDFLLKNSVWLSVVGFIFAIIGFYLKRTALDLALLILYSLVLGFYLLIRVKNAKRRWGVVKDSLTGLAISGAFVRVFDKKNSLSDTQITDDSGRYSFYVDPGDYSLFAQAYGYKFPAENQTTEVKTVNNSQLLGFTAGRSQWLDKQILVDPDKNGTTKPVYNVTNAKVLPYKSDNLISPFNSTLKTT
ncbi:MAG: carboxypeptidase-like regulatory domain-containing protein [Candidatus Dojkabacteria bacterium]